MRLGYICTNVTHLKGQVKGGLSILTVGFDIQNGIQYFK